MNILNQLRLAAREIFHEAMQTIDAGEAVRRALLLTGSNLHVCDKAVALGNRRIYSIAIGKAALTMARALDEVLGTRIVAGIITTGTATSETARRDAGEPNAWPSQRGCRAGDPGSMAA